VHPLRDDAIVVGMYWVYILRRADDSLYVGQTDDRDARLSTTTEAPSGFTASRRPVTLTPSEARGGQGCSCPRRLRPRCSHASARVPDVAPNEVAGPEQVCGRSLSLTLSTALRNYGDVFSGSQVSFGLLHSSEEGGKVPSRECPLKRLG